MKRWTGCLLALCLGCGKGDVDESTPGAPAAQAEPAQPQAVAEKPTDSEATAIAALKSDPVGKVKAYVVYNQHWLDVLKLHGARSQEYKAKEKAGQFEGVTGLARNLATLNDLGREEKAALDKAQAESGLSDKELSALGELMANAQMQEAMQKGLAEMKSANAAEQLAKFEQAIKSAPAEVQEEAKKPLEDMKQAQVAAQEAASMKDMRAKYGDAVVSAMLSAVPMLNAQLKQYQASAN